MIRLNHVKDREAEMTTRIGFTGTQRGMTDAQKKAVREIIFTLGTIEQAHHGDCIGADADFHEISIDLDIPVVLHPPVNESKRAFCQGATLTNPAKEYLDRNNDIVDSSSILIATPSGQTEKRRSGTWATVRYARKRRRVIYLVFPEGSVQEEGK
jgi:hypothetical protein